MKIAIRAAALLSLFFLLTALGFGQIVISTSSTASTMATLGANSSAVVTLAPGPNTVTIDIAPGTGGSYTGQFILQVAYQGNSGPLRTWPSASITNSLTPGSTGIGANATGAWTVTIPGPGYVCLVASSLSAGTPNVFLAAGQGGVGGVSASSVSGAVTANAGTNLNTSALALDTSAQSILTKLGTVLGFNLVDLAGTNKASISAAGALKVDNSGVTQPVSASALPLPAGAALEAGHLAAVDTSTATAATNSGSVVTNTGNTATNTGTISTNSTTVAGAVAGGRVKTGKAITMLGAASGATNGSIASGVHLLERIIGDNASGTTLYLQIFDATSLPSNGTAAIAEVTVTFGVSSSPTENKEYFMPDWIATATGCWYAWSTTSGTLTLAGSGTGLGVKVYGG